MKIIHYKISALNREGLNPGYAALVDAIHVPLFDRTGTVDQGLEHVVLDPMPKLNAAFEKSFEQCCDERAKTLLALDIPLCVSWSGGIDSTVALVALLRNSTPEQRAKNLSVLLSYTSEMEYPKFYVEHISGKLNEVRHGGTPCDAIPSTGLTVTGELGDQLFGSTLLERYIVGGRNRAGAQRFAPEVLGDLPADYEHSMRLLFEEPWDKWVRPFLVELLNGHEGRAETAIEYIRPTLAKAPFKITNGYSLIWWLNFNFKWQDVTLRFITNGGATRQDYERVHHFFRTEDFQQWSMQESNQRYKIKQVPEGWSHWMTYKWVAKEYIASFTGDRVYAERKLKVASLTACGSDDYVHLTEDFVKVTT